ncbi:MAG: hypothetical protein Q9160_002410 [Pyrenula sp. 1 TL-2023]
MAKKKSSPPAKNATKKPSPNAPRLEKAQRLLYRFYEPLLLLHTLNPTMGEHSPSIADDEPDFLTTQRLQRRFLEDLAYFCDYKKGGDTVTAIAVEDRPQGPIFWFASNTPKDTKMKGFLEEVLDRLRQSPSSRPNDREDLKVALAHKAIDFGHRRIKSYRSLLGPHLLKASERLARQTSDHELASWLERLTSHEQDHRQLCQISYQDRRSSCMKRLANLSQDTAQASSDDSPCMVFRKIRHYIGRLGYHFRAAKTLVEAADRLPHLFINYEVQPCPSQHAPFSIPAPDAKTTFPSIVGRMFPANDDEKAQDCRDRLAFLDDRFHVFDQFLRVWTDKNFQPRIHCELILLEHFYAKGLQFVASDKYIGCSKPACYCCALYIRNHPGRFVEPASHHKIWPNWRPPDVSYLPNGKGAESHRNVLNNVVAHIRGDLKNQILDRSNLRRWHPDSITGISSDMYGSVVSQGSPAHSAVGTVASVAGDTDLDSDLELEGGAKLS